MMIIFVSDNETDVRSTKSVVGCRPGLLAALRQVDDIIHFSYLPDIQARLRLRKGIGGNGLET